MGSPSRFVPLLLVVASSFAASLSTQPSAGVPPPPWSFTAARIHYQFMTIPADAASGVIPTMRGEKSDGDNLTLLSVGGQTLGGLFAIEYSDSPIGPYKEVAVLAGLVTKGIDVFRVGAWASHIFVDRQDAADYGKRYWGLPATVVPIDFDLSHASDETPSFIFGTDSVGVAGWTSPNSMSNDVDNQNLQNPFLGKLDVTLPSYSGKLTTKDPLLRYPLTISDLGTMSTGKARMAQFQDTFDDETLISLLDNSQPLVSIDVSGATLVAGIPSTI